MKSILNRRNFFAVLVALMVMCITAGVANCGTYSGGTGEPNEPYLIFTAEQMNAIGADANDWDKHFLLCADIDLSGFTGTTYNIIGNFDTPFRGVFDGNDHTISNFNYAYNGTDDYIALFGYIDHADATIKNLRIVDANVFVGSLDCGYVGTIAGRLHRGSIVNCHASNVSIDAKVSSYIGGLVGRSDFDSKIESCFVSGSITAQSAVGGLLAFTYGIINDCHTSIKITAGNCSGGLIGLATNSTVTNCSSKGSVYNSKAIDNELDCAGGLIGEIYSVNQQRGDIINCHSSCEVWSDGDNPSLFGGLIGIKTGYGDTIDCFATGKVSAGSIVGGLVGANYGYEIKNCLATGDVEGEFECVGGLIGDSEWDAVQCYATGNVTGYEKVGGLIGRNDCGKVFECFSSGNVTGVEHIGGLVGENNGYKIELEDGHIYNSYAKGSVTGQNCVGGFVGYIRRGQLFYCYSSGAVSGTTSVGGLVGGVEDWQVITSSFWDVNTSGQTTSASGMGKTTAEMYDPNTFIDAGWDFETHIWKICDLAEYPMLSWQICPIPAPALHSEPEVTLGMNNTLSWDHVPNADKYYLECANDSNFSSIFDNSGWVTNTNHLFTNLEQGCPYWYRVKAKTPARILTWLQTSQQDFEHNLLNNVSVDDVPSDVKLLFLPDMLGVDTVGGASSSWNLSGKFINGNFFYCAHDCTLKKIEQYIYSGPSQNIYFLVYEASPGSSTYYRIHSNSINSWGKRWYSSGSISVPLKKDYRYCIGIYTSSDIKSYQALTGDQEISWGTKNGSISFSVASMPDSLQLSSSFYTFKQRLTANINRNYYAPDGTMSARVSIPENSEWNTIDFNSTVPEGTNLAVDILDASDDSVILEDANDGEDLSWIDVDTIKLKANLSTNNPNITPALHDWSVTYTNPTTIIESDWSNVESSLQVALAEAVETVLDANSLKNANMKNALINKINAVLAMIDEGQYQEAMSKMESATSEKANRSYEGALNKLENDILAKTDGCAETGEPDKNDWIITCEGQNQVYPLIVETIEYVRSLME